MMIMTLIMMMMTVMVMMMMVMMMMMAFKVCEEFDKSRRVTNQNSISGLLKQGCHLDVSHISCSEHNIASLQSLQVYKRLSFS